MRHEAFSSSCREVHALLDASPSEVPDVTRLLEDEFVRGVLSEDRAPAQALVEVVARVLEHGRRVAASYRKGLHLYRRTRSHLLRMGHYLPAQKLESRWSDLSSHWRRVVVRKRAPVVEETPVVTLPPVVTVSPTKPGPSSMRQSLSQRLCASKLKALAELFFDPPVEAVRGIPVQTNALLTGPTGCGKTSVVRAVADDLGADFLHLTHGSWIVEGAHDGYPTVRTILYRAAYNPRLVLFIDEFDKFALGSPLSGSWETSLRADLWMVLDRALSWGALATNDSLMKSLPEKLRSAAALEGLFKTGVFIVAAGTWQELHRPKAAAGFAAEACPRSLDSAALNRHGDLPEEILRRFNSDLLHMEYPTVAELHELMEADGLLELGKSLGQVIDPVLEHARVGMLGLSALTSLKTSLLLRRRSCRRVTSAAMTAC